jgi:chromosomal replication initiation ATPase DnaA
MKPSEMEEERRYQEQARDDARRIRIARIIAIVADHHALDRREIIGQRRFRKVSRPRQEVMYLARCAGWSTTQIGLVLDNRDHTTIMSGSRVYAKRHALPRSWEV